MYKKYQSIIADVSDVIVFFVFVWVFFFFWIKKIELFRNLLGSCRQINSA